MCPFVDSLWVKTKPKGLLQAFILLNFQLCESRKLSELNWTRRPIQACRGANGPRCKGEFFRKDPWSLNPQLSWQQTNKNNRQVVLTWEEGKVEKQRWEFSHRCEELCVHRWHWAVRPWWPIMWELPDWQAEPTGGHCVYSWDIRTFNIEVISYSSERLTHTDVWLQINLPRASVHIFWSPYCQRDFLFFKFSF